MRPDGIGLRFRLLCCSRDVLGAVTFIPSRAARLFCRLFAWQVAVRRRVLGVNRAQVFGARHGARNFARVAATRKRAQHKSTATSTAPTTHTHAAPKMADEPPAKVRKNRWGETAGAAAANAAAAAAVPPQAPPPISAEAQAAAAAVAAQAAAMATAGVGLGGLGASVQEAKERAKEALAKAQLAAEVQRTLQQNLPAGAAASLLPAPGAMAAAAAAGAASIALPSGVVLPPNLAVGGGVPTAPKPALVTIDAQGRLLDERGKVIQSTGQRPQASIKVNQSARVNPLLDDAPAPDESSSRYYDPRMAGGGGQQGRDVRKKRAFSFVSEGHFSRKADDMRAKAAVELMLQEASKPASKRKAAAAVIAATVASGTDGGGGGGGVSTTETVSMSAATLERRLAEVPTVEWWDAPLITVDATYEEPNLEGLSHLIEHPVPIHPPAEPPPPPPMPLPLTKKERKKLRTQRRLAAEKEKQDQIRCGLIAPPPPKVKISNLMTVMKDEAVQDPSAVEAKVRAEMAQRIRNHEERNQARKLTPAERRAKKKRKLTTDPSGGGVPVSLYRIDQPPNEKKRYSACAQWHGSGITFTSPHLSSHSHPPSTLLSLTGTRSTSTRSRTILPASYY